MNRHIFSTRTLVLAIVGVAASVASLLGGCSGWQDDRGRGDAPVANDKDDSPAQVINFPDRFANIAFKCFNGTGLYSTTRNAPPAVIVDDPNCNGDDEEVPLG